MRTVHFGKRWKVPSRCWSHRNSSLGIF